MKALKIIGNIILIIVTFGISCAIFGTEVTMHTLNGFKSIFTAEGITNIITNIDFTEYADDFSFEIDDIDNDIYQSMDKNGFDKEMTKEILNSKEFKNLLAKYVSDSFKSIADDKEVPKPTVDDVMAIFENNDEILEKIAEHEGVKLTEKQKKQILSSLRKSMPEVINEIPDIGKELHDNNKEITATFKLLESIFSVHFIVILGSIVAVFYLIIALLRMSFKKAIIWLGVPTIFAGIVSMFISFGVKTADILSEVTDASKKILENVLLPDISNNFLMSGLLGIAIGIGLIVLYVVLNNKTKIVVPENEIKDQTV